MILDDLCEPCVVKMLSQRVYKRHRRFHAFSPALRDADKAWGMYPQEMLAFFEEDEDEFVITRHDDLIKAGCFEYLELLPEEVELKT